MVQEVCYGDMFQSPSPTRGHPQTQTSALSAATSAMASTYGYPFYPTTAAAQTGYPDYTGYPTLPGPQPTGEGQLTGLNPVSGNGGASPTWTAGCTYPTNISPRTGSTGGLHVAEDWGSAFTSTQPMASVSTQLPQGHAVPSYSYAHRGTPTTFDPMGLGQYGTTTSQSPAGTMQGLHPQPPSPEQPSVVQASSSSGVSSRHARPPYDWMKKQATYQTVPTNGQYTTLLHGMYAI